MRVFKLITLGLLTIGGQSGAQVRPRSDSLPRDLVTALLGGSMGAPAIDASKRPAWCMT